MILKVALHFSTLEGKVISTATEHKVQVKVIRTAIEHNVQAKFISTVAEHEVQVKVNSIAAEHYRYNTYANTFCL